MNAYLVSYHSTSSGWVTLVVEARNRDQAVAYAARSYGRPNDAARINVQILTGLPLVESDAAGRVQVRAVAEVVA